MIYAMSDIHGQYEMYLNMLKQISFSENDTLYIIGDAIDRGDKPIELLMDIMGRKNVVFLNGNHEMFLYNYETAILNKMSILSVWLQNGGYTTLDAYDNLSNQEKEDIIDFIGNSPIVIPNLTVNKKTFYLCHSTYLERKIDRLVKLNDLNPFETDHVLWQRNYPKAYDKRKSKYISKDVTVIAGHTPTKHYLKDKDAAYSIFHDKKNGYIDIDCGCASIPRGDPKGRLACLRLDDMTEYYVGNNVF